MTPMAAVNVTEVAFDACDGNVMVFAGGVHCDLAAQRAAR
jgi:hypothetical protein